MALKSFDIRPLPADDTTPGGSTYDPAVGWWTTAPAQQTSDPGTCGRCGNWIINCGC